MPKPKYNFHEVKEKYKGKPLPDDINAPVLEIARKMGDDNFIKALLQSQKEKLFGPVVHYSQFPINGQAITLAEMTCHIQFGICLSFDLLKPIGDSNTLSRKIFNKNVTLKKN